MSTTTPIRLDALQLSLPEAQRVTLEAFERLEPGSQLEVWLTTDAEALYAAFAFNYPGLFVWDCYLTQSGAWRVLISPVVNSGKLQNS